jgi:transposase-like protein
MSLSPCHYGTDIMPIGPEFTSFEERNKAICAYYQEGHKLAETAERFSLGTMRTKQILEKGGVWRPPIKGVRTNFLGVNVKPETKQALKERASKAGKSVSEYVAETLEHDIDSKGGEG